MMECVGKDLQYHGGWQYTMAVILTLHHKKQICCTASPNMLLFAVLVLASWQSVVVSNVDMKEKERK